MRNYLSVIWFTCDVLTDKVIFKGGPHTILHLVVNNPVIIMAIKNNFIDNKTVNAVCNVTQLLFLEIIQSNFYFLKSLEICYLHYVRFYEKYHFYNQLFKQIN